jgi:hypothetical protein
MLTRGQNLSPAPTGDRTQTSLRSLRKLDCDAVPTRQLRQAILPTLHAAYEAMASVKPA